MFISLDVALVTGDFLFSRGLFNPSFGIVDDELICFSMLFFLNWGDLKAILNNISGCRKASEFEVGTQEACLSVTALELWILITISTQNNQTVTWVHASANPAIYEQYAHNTFPFFSAITHGRIGGSFSLCECKT